MLCATLVTYECGLPRATVRVARTLMQSGPYLVIASSISATVPSVYRYLVWCADCVIFSMYYWCCAGRLAT